MRGLKRPDIVPPTLTDQGIGALTARRHLAEKIADPAKALEFPEHWNRPDVRGALYAMQGWVCAYCEREFTGSERGDVEHFRPKRGGDSVGHEGYFWLAYEFQNYFLACRQCNSVHKGNRFPLESGATRGTYATRMTIANERRLLTNPELDPVEDWFRIDCIDALCFVQPAPGLKDTSVELARVTETIRFFELNIDRRLIQSRVRARETATRELRARDFAALRRRASRYCANGSTYRAYLNAFAPDVPLPTPEEQLQWFLEDIDQVLYHDSMLLQRGLDSPRQQERIAELRWLLAILWKKPPAGLPEEIAAWLEQRQLRAWVEVVYKLL